MVRDQEPWLRAYEIRGRLVAPNEETDQCGELGVTRDSVAAPGTDVDGASEQIRQTVKGVIQLY